MSAPAVSSAQPSRPLGRSIGAIFAGVLVVVVLSVATDRVLESTGILPAPGQPMDDNLFLLATVYRTIYGLIGAYITALVASYRRMQHALLLGVVGVVLGTIGAITMWNAPAAIGHHWYPIALVVLAIPQSWAGGQLRMLQLRATRP
jgi:hypothetical protein